MLRPGVEMVVEIDPDSLLDPSLGIGRRLPARGRIVLDVQRLPVMEFTIVPLLSTTNPDYSVIGLVNGMARDWQGNELMRLPRTLLPTGDWRVTAHEPVWTDLQATWDNRVALLNTIRAIRTMEGGRGYWMGAPAKSVGGGIADVSSWTSVSILATDVIAHELGHNLSLRHAPCGNPNPWSIDPRFPYSYGQIGAWGYDFDTGKLVSPATPDVMSYCGAPEWISDYFFGNALRRRMRVETSSSTTRALLLWGSDSETEGPHLYPAFVVDAMPVLPDSAGGYTLTGRDAGGHVMFSVSFAMPVVADAEEGTGGFVYTLPVRPGWEALASLTLSAPDGRKAVLDDSTDRPMTILRDAQTGWVRAFLDGPSAAAQADAAGGPGVAAALGAVAITSRGIPDARSWRR